MKVAVLVLCHESPALLAQRFGMSFFRSDAVKVYVHYDANRSADRLAALKTALPGEVQFQVLDNRVACAWGEYSLVEATRRLMQAATSDRSFDADYLLLCSGSCVPMRPLASLLIFLEQHRGTDFIQAHDIARGPWVKDGLEEERYRYYFPLNFLKRKRLFDQLTNWQRAMKVHRKVPHDLRIHFGSQWFCIGRDTATQVVAQFALPGLAEFFRHSWIPDEFAIQTLVAAVQTPERIAGFGLTYYEFDKEGRPLILDNGHEDHLARQPFFIARKVAPEAKQLLAHLEGVAQQPETDLAYFASVGTPTVDYQRFLADAILRKSSRAHVGNIADEWRGPMDTNRRRYYVLLGSSRSHMMAVLQAASRSANLPIFCMPFARPNGVIAPVGGAAYGFGAEDGPRRDYDPGAYLFELANADPSTPALFGVDGAQLGWVRDFLPWDSHATLVDCDPDGLSLEQRAVAAMSEAGDARDGELIHDTLAAALSGSILPRDLFRFAQAESMRRCHLLRLCDVAEDWGDPTFRAVHAAWSSIHAMAYFISHQEAAPVIWDR